MAPNVCNCNLDYYDLDCGGWNCSLQQDCNTPNGNCTAPNTCTCLPEWTGDDCSIAVILPSSSSSSSQPESNSLLNGLLGIGFFSGVGLFLITVLIAIVAVIVTIIIIVLKIRKKGDKNKNGTVLEKMETSGSSMERTASIHLQEDKLTVDYEAYKILKKIAQGTYGAVYMAQDTRTGEMVAMKKLKFPDISEDDDMIQRLKEDFEKEIQLLANLRHKNIVAFYAGSLEYPNYAIITEFCDHGFLIVYMVNTAKSLSGNKK